MSSLNTPPLVRNPRSLSRAVSASSRDAQGCGMSLASSGERSYRFLSIGSPGLILFWTPSRPAIIIAVNARYGFAVGSGKRTSMRRAFGLGTYGIRHAAERLRAEYARLIGASN